MSRPVRLAINGFGRIGRAFLRTVAGNPSFEVVAINDLANIQALAHLLKYDSVHGRSPLSVSIYGEQLVYGHHSMQVLHESDPALLPWGDLKIDVLVESTGIFLDQAGAQRHLLAGAGRVILSAPPKDQTPTVVMGINHHIIKPQDRIVSNASCTTNNAAPMLWVLKHQFGLQSAFISTVHSYTSDQRLIDAPHHDLRRARAAALSIIPTTTGAAKALTRIFPEMEGRIGGGGIRVPVPDGSLTDITCMVSRSTTPDEVNRAFKSASENTLKGILDYTEDPIVSVDVLGNPHSCLFDAQLTSVLGNMVKVVGWYDNEIGYSNRLADLAIYLQSQPSAHD
jgi:glyceraldehyde 3-phosphate dehydrogenase